MINIVYRLTGPKIFEEFYEEIDINEDVIVRPIYLSICKADQRYYQGKRDTDVLDKKLPMALIHEGIGQVVKDNTNTFEVDDYVVMIPNNPLKKSNFRLNYDVNSKFRSSDMDGFTSDLISFKKDRLIKIPNDFDLKISSFLELMSVSFHAIDNFDKLSLTDKYKIGVWGDGIVSYLTSLFLTVMFPNVDIYVFGKYSENLSLFSFVSETFKINEIPENLLIDHAFECVGTQNSQLAIDQCINHINPQGLITLLGVSEYSIPINTRKVLEKGLTITGISRSEREDFEGIINLLENNPFIFKYLNNIIHDVIEINSLDDLKDSFDEDLLNFGKTILKWNM